MRLRSSTSGTDAPTRTLRARSGCASIRRQPGSSAALTAIKAWGPRVWHNDCMSEKPLILPDRATVLALAAETQFAPNGIVSRTLLRTRTAAWCSSASTPARS